MASPSQCVQPQPEVIETDFNGTPPMRTVALDGYGLAYVPEDLVQSDNGEGWLIQVLDDSSSLSLATAFVLQSSAAFNLVVGMLRYSS